MIPILNPVSNQIKKYQQGNNHRNTNTPMAVFQPGKQHIFLIQRGLFEMICRNELKLLQSFYNNELKPSPTGKIKEFERESILGTRLKNLCIASMI